MGKKKVEYRFKTQDEFLKDYGPEWRKKVPYAWSKGMDVLFGTRLSDHTTEVFHEDTQFKYIKLGKWSIGFDMLVQIPPPGEEIDVNTATLLLNMLKEIVDESTDTQV